jgi:hypothetical protein
MRPSLKGSELDESRAFSLPPPVGGWNARDNLSRMPKTDAVFLDNWFPNTTTVDIRPGSETNATLPEGEVIRTFFDCAKRDGTTKRFVATATGIWDITAGGAIAAADEVVTNGVWQYTNIEVGGVSYLWCCCGDGSNKVRLYNANADTWMSLTDVSVPAMTGFDTNLVTNVHLYGTRLILCKKDSLSFWYLPLNSVGGAATEFPLGALFTRGGYLVATETWTTDGGTGLDDRFVAISSEGEVVVYEGSDPSLSTFLKVGVFYIGKPVGKRCLVRMGSEVGILTEQGLYPLSRALNFAGNERRIALTNKIDIAFLTYWEQFKAQFGWQPLVFPGGPAVLINIPIGRSLSYQFVMNSMTGAWARFYGWNAEVIGTSAGNLYFAMGNVVKQGWTGTADDAVAITASSKSAWTYAERRYRSKKIHLVKPIMRCTSPINISLALDTDFQDRSVLSSQASFAQNIAIWDISLYNQAYWSGGEVMSNKWKSVSHKPGKAFSLRTKIIVKGIEVSWADTEFLVQDGGLL